MRPAACWMLFFGSVLAGAPAQATPVLIGARAGIHAPTAWQLPPGPSVGADVTWSAFRLVALQAVVDQSWHWVDDTERSSVMRVSSSAASLGIQYRVDVASIVPYVSLAFVGLRLQAQGGPEVWAWGGAAGVGVLVPLREHLFVGGEARYAIRSDGAFPAGQQYLVRFGWRSGSFL